MDNVLQHLRAHRLCGGERHARTNVHDAATIRGGLEEREVVAQRAAKAEELDHQ
jgi:hypothetical protein